MLKKAETVSKQFFRRRGLSIAKWAEQNGFNRALVYAVLSGRRSAIRGQSHEIAVSLGLKKGEPEGLLASLGVDLKDVTPHGSRIKPIEAFFRDMVASEVARLLTKHKCARARNPKID